MKIKNIFFDFDGVLAESVSAKTDAFREMYLPYGNEIADKVVEYHINHGGVSRFEKFRYWQKTFFNEELTDKRMETLVKKFSGLVLQKVIKSEPVTGSLDFLKMYSSNLKFWIITGTPTSEIEIIVKERNLSSYFIGVYGSPEKKSFWTEYLIQKHNLKREETLFLGDATTDKEAADFSKLHFALRVNEENGEIFKNFKGLRFVDFNMLEDILKNSL